MKKKENPFIVSIQNMPSSGIKIKGNIELQDLEIQNEERIKIEDNLSYDLHLYNVDTSTILLQGKLSTTIRCECDYCLEYFKHKIEIKEVCHMYENITDVIIDLTDDIREDILIDFPQRHRCSENCKGLCQCCGTNLNINKCRCFDTTDENNIWSSLDNLNLTD